MERTKEGYALIWKHTSADYKGLRDGKRYVLEFVPGSGTCSVPLDSISNASYASKLAAATVSEARAKARAQSIKDALDLAREISARNLWKETEECLDQEVDPDDAEQSLDYLISRTGQLEDLIVKARAIAINL